jgi:hypothetical protein
VYLTIAVSRSFTLSIKGFETKFANLINRSTGSHFRLTNLFTHGVAISCRSLPSFPAAAQSGSMRGADALMPAVGSERLAAFRVVCQKTGSGDIRPSGMDKVAQQC